MIWKRAKLWARFFAQIRYPHDLRLVISAFLRRRAYSVPQETWNLIDSCAGFLSTKEAGLIHHIATSWPVEGPVVELSSYEGRSTIAFARAGRMVHAIDAWSLQVADLSAYSGGAIDADAVWARFRRNIERANVQARLIPHRGLTNAVGRTWNIPCAILFVDAGHTYADVRDDLEVWTPHLKPGGILMMHDVLGDVYLEVTRAASELLHVGWRVHASGGSIVAFTHR